MSTDWLYPIGPAILCFQKDGGDFSLTTHDDGTVVVSIAAALGTCRWSATYRTDTRHLRRAPDQDVSNVRALIRRVRKRVGLFHHARARP